MTTIPSITSDSISQYIKHIKQFPRLTEQEEREYFRQYQTTGCLDSMYKIITSNLRFVVFVAHRYRHYNMPLADLIQEGNIGLMVAAKKFSLTYNVRFVSYAVDWIKPHILKYVTDNFGPSKFVTTNNKRKLFFNKSVIYNEDGSVNDIEQIAKDLNVRIQDVKSYLSFMQPTMSLYDENDDAIDILDKSSTIDQYIELEEHDRMFTEAMNAIDSLSERAKDIIHHRFLSDSKMTLDELADKYEVSAERIRQIEKRALSQLKSLITV